MNFSARSVCDPSADWQVNLQKIPLAARAENLNQRGDVGNAPGTTIDHQAAIINSL
jgi:hypothetical protein